MREYFNEKGLKWAREYNIGNQSSLASKYSAQAINFWGIFEKLEDRKFLESFLEDKRFITWYVEKDRKFFSYYSWSGRRSQVDKILAEWDGNINVQQSSSEQDYYYLGVVKGTIELHRAPEIGDNSLCIYFIPTTIAKNEWFNQVPTHWLFDYFWEASFNNMQWQEQNIPFRFLGVTPGEYRITAVWDLAEPYTFSSDNIKGPPQQGDYQSKELPVITVKAGEIIEGINIDCTQMLTDGDGTD
ncbi:hypothetical protein ACFLZ8_06760 [Planctomycetota bacterium]